MELKVAAVVLCVIMMLGCIGGEKPVVTTTEEPKVAPKTAEERKAEVQQQLNDFKGAVEDSDLVRCQELNSQRLKDVCVRNIAVKESKASLCNSIKTESLKDTCYHRIATTTDDKSLCDKIVNDFIKESCLEKGSA